MDQTTMSWTGGAAHQAMPAVWCDGLDGQEDELEDVHDGILDPPTDDEGPGSIMEPNDDAVALEKEDEDNDLIEEDEAGGTQRFH
jgi:hypothetical protein